jgi:hypothetical protein
LKQVFKITLLLILNFINVHLFAQKNNINADSTIYKNVTITFKTGFVLNGTILFQNDSIITFFANNFKQATKISKSKIEKIVYPPIFDKIEPISLTERKKKRRH